MPISRRELNPTAGRTLDQTKRASDTEARLAQLEARLAKLEKAVKIGESGDVTLTGMTVSIEATTALNLKSMTMTITSMGPMTLKGSLIRLN